jgi:2-oxoglutarate dehydrogenase complex dehydrogenase (E1) component-like enzyme
VAQQIRGTASMDFLAFNRAMREMEQKAAAQHDDKKISSEGAAPTAGAAVVHETHKFRPSGTDG